jgi:ArsR family transcriptional regulator
MDAYSQQADRFKALAHPIRLAILEVLREGEACVCHIQAILGLRQAYISQQLMLLRRAGLVADRKDGLNVFYRVTDPNVFVLMDLTRISDAPPGRLRKPDPANCPCPNCNQHVAVAA